MYKHTSLLKERNKQTKKERKKPEKQEDLNYTAPYEI